MVRKGDQEGRRRWALTKKSKFIVRAVYGGMTFVHEGHPQKDRSNDGGILFNHYV